MIAVILVNWNGWEDTVACLRSLRAARRPDDLLVIVCDNASTDGSAARIASWADAEFGDTVSPQIRTWRERSGATHAFTMLLIETGANLGFAGGNNVGIAHALGETACRFVFLLNNDTEVDANCLTAFVAKMDAQPAIAVCGATLLYHGEPDVVQGLGGRYDRWRAESSQVARDSRRSDLPTDERAVERRLDYVIGAAMFIRPEVLRRTGGLSEAYFLFYEELDLSQRLLPEERLGWCREAIVYHKVGASIGTGGKRASDFSVYFDHRSKTTFYLRHWPHLLPMLAIGELRMLVWFARMRDSKGMRAIALGLWDGLRRRRDFDRRL